MRFLDRLTGEKLSHLPDAFLPGRYCLLEPLDVNGHSRLQAGDLVTDDGSGSIRIQGTESQVLSIEQTDDDRAESDLSAEAIVSIAGKLAHANGLSVSPMLPAEMAAQCALEELERNLATVLRDGHLHSISDRPRRDLRYDDLVAPVARARRLATSALSHLASHSDCWQQRTLSGVQPRKVLARFSEDDYAIYENRLYKRLLDRLDRHLAKRLARIRSVNARLARALEFQDSEQTHFRLRQDICRLWGESYLDDKTGMQLEAGKRALSEIEAQLRAIRGLKQRGLYLHVPAASVPAQVHRTNILNHDPHYRHLPSLWESLKDERDERKMRPEERLAKYQQLHLAYRDYVGLVLRRALEKYGLQGGRSGCLEFCWAGITFSVQQDGQDWLICNPHADADLRLIPVAWFGKDVEKSENLNSSRVVCWPGCSDSISSRQCLAISPLDLYVVEKMGRLIDEWMLSWLIEGYGKELGPLPTPVKQMADKLPDNFESISNTHVRLVAPLDSRHASEIESKLQEFATEQIKNQVLTAVDLLTVLSRLCSHDAQFSASPNRREFSCQCRTCNTIWSIKTSSDKRVFEMRPKGAEDLPLADRFNRFGRDCLGFEVSL